jgi:chromosome partitioning protein
LTWTRKDLQPLGGERERPILPEMEAAMPDQLPGLLETARKAGVDLAIIDTRPSVEADAAQVAVLSDFLLIPTRPAILDLRAILATLDIVKGSTNRAALVLNACQPPRGSGEASATTDARNALKAFGVPVAPVTVVQRAALSQALVGGMTASETEPEGKAAKDIRGLWRFVEKELFR